MTHNKIENNVLERVTPSSEYRKKTDSAIHKLKEKIQSEITKRKLPVSIELVGSTAKDTYLKNNMDIDLFLVFPATFPKEEIARHALEIGRTLLEKTEESYAEHPYIRGYFNDYKTEIVPCYKIENASQKLSAVDRTPLHTSYVKKHLKESQKQEVRLLKQFLRGIGCYGAEAEVEGFSGYLCEILIIKYGSFRNLTEETQNWKRRERLALTDGKHPSFDTPLTFIDPVDINRNVASALVEDRFNLFVKACQEYVKNPCITFFFPNDVKPWSLKKIKSEIQKQGCLYIGVKLAKPGLIAENLYPQVRKAAKSIWDACKRYNFTIYDSTFHIDEEESKIYIIVKAKSESLSKTVVHAGPPVELKSNAKEFLSKWSDNPKVVKKPYEKNGRLYVEIKRDYREIKDFLKDQIKHLSMGKHLDKIVNKKYKIVELDDMLKENLKTFWTEYLDQKMSWER